MAKFPVARVASILAVGGLLAWALGFLQTAGRAAEGVSNQPAPRRVRVTEVSVSPPTRRFRVHGVARARDRAALSFTVAGRLTHRPVQAGDRVRQGQLLAQLDRLAYAHQAEAAEAATREAEAQLSLTERDGTRLAALGEAKAISREQVDRIGSALDAARAARDAAETQRREAARALQETQLRAPFSGTVVSVHMQPGEFAAPGAPVVVLSSAGGLETQVEVPGRVASRLTPGDRAALRLPLDGDQLLAGAVTSVGSSALGRGRLFPVIVSFDATSGTQARPGSAVEVTLEVSEPATLTVLASAVMAPSGRDPSVLRVRQGVVERVPIELGTLYGARIGVTGELHAGERVVTAGYTGLVDGERVEVVP